MARARPRAAEEASSLAAPLAWGLLFLALALVPDEKLLRWKLLALEAGVAALAALSLARAARRPPALLVRTPLDLPVAAYAAAALLFYAVSPEPRNSENELCRALFSAFCFFAASQTLPRRGDAGPPLLAWSAGAALAGGYALIQRLGPFERPFATFGNPIFLGAFLAPSLIVTAGLWLARPGARGWLSAAAVLQGAGLWLAQSRAAFAGLLAAALLWALVRLSGARRWAAVGLAGAAAAALAWHFSARAWTHGLIWEGAWRLFLAHPWLGCGLGRFHLEFPAYAPDALKALWPQEKMIVNFAHNEYLQVLCETGVVGLAAFVAVPASALRLLLGEPQAEPLAQASLLAALAVFAAAVVSPDLRFGVSPFIAFSALGAGAALASPRATPAPPAPARLLPLGAALALLSFWATLAARPPLALRALGRLPEFHVAANPALEAARSGLERRLADDPSNPDLAEELGYLYARERAWEPAIARFELAARLDPSRPGPYNNLGNIYYSMGEPDKALSYWEKAVAVDPRGIDARLNLGKVLYERGRLKEAAGHLERVLQLSPSNEKARVMLEKMVE